MNKTITIMIGLFVFITNNPSTESDIQSKIEQTKKECKKALDTVYFQGRSNGTGSIKDRVKNVERLNYRIGIIPYSLNTITQNIKELETNLEDNPHKAIIMDDVLSDIEQHVKNNIDKLLEYVPEHLKIYAANENNQGNREFDRELIEMANSLIIYPSLLCGRGIRGRNSWCDSLESDIQDRWFKHLKEKYSSEE